MKCLLLHVAIRIWVEPSYLNIIESDQPPPLSEKIIVALDLDLNENPDQLLTLSGKVSMEIQSII